MIIGFAGGGTGGHIFPISSLIDFIKKSNKFNNKVDKIYWFGQQGSLEEKVSSQISDANAKLNFITIVSGKIRRKPNVLEFCKNIVDIFRLSWGIIQSIYHIKSKKIDVVFSKGGYVSLPVSIACKITNTKLIIHESDTHAGISTKIGARFADKVFLGFEKSIAGGEHIGQILSDDLCSGQVNATDDKTTILVNCGSLGSKTIHQTILKLFEDNKIAEKFDRKILVGIINQEFADKYKKYDNIEVINFADQETMGQLYQISDISICRGGSTTLVEQHLFNIKQVIIPIPWTHDQFDNARYFEGKYNDIIIDQNDKGYEDKLKDTLSNLVGYKKQQPDINEIKDYIVGVKEKILGYIIK